MSGAPLSIRVYDKTFTPRGDIGDPKFVTRTVRPVGGDPSQRSKRGIDFVKRRTKFLLIPLIIVRVGTSPRLAEPLPPLNRPCNGLKARRHLVAFCVENIPQPLDFSSQLRFSLG